jgi:hypothetical protein
MKSMAVPVRARSSRRRSTIPASTVTSSAVVGSSRISSVRPRHQRHGDDDALLLPARELVRIGVEHALGIGQMHRLDHLPRGRAGSGVAARSWIIGTSMSCRPTVIAGFSEAIGSW